MLKIQHPSKKQLINYLTIALFVSNSLFSFSQEPVFTLQDTLRGSVTPERAWWDLTHYHLNVQAYPSDSSIAGNVLIHYKVLSEGSIMQIDLQQPMMITSVVQNGELVEYNRLGNVYYLQLSDNKVFDTIMEVNIHFAGTPVVSTHPPWDGGLVWKVDDNGNPFIATACQGAGASLWWPCKDHMYDEPDSMHISITAPETLMAVSNGRLIGAVKNRKEKTRTFHWFVSNPISNYGVNMNIGDYSHFNEEFAGELGPLDCDYYVLRYNLERAIEHFRDVPRMLKAFEYWFGPYPFYDDGFKLVEVPYPGMEHQSSVTYGNLFENGFMKRDVSHTGWGLKFDFIIIHESGHEWFANNITYKDIADMWIHESFTAYSECLFTEYYYGKEAGFSYVRGTRANIANNRPIIGKYEVNYEGSGDMYAKGANMLHTLRQVVNNDSTWRALLRGLNRDFYHQTVTTEQIENYVADFTKLCLRTFFNQYLRDNRIPVLEYEIREDQLKYRWSNCVEGFDLPVSITLDGEERMIYPNTSWTYNELDQPIIHFIVDPDFYVAVLRL